MSEKKIKRAFLEIEEDERTSKQRIISLLNGHKNTSEISTKKIGLKTFPLKPPEHLLSRIANFLPQIASDNKELVKKDIKSIDIENVEGTERIIEMNLDLGIFEINKPSERNIIINPKELVFDNSVKPKNIVIDMETKNESGGDENLQKLESHILFKDNDENSESYNIIMDIKSLNRKKPKIIVLDDNQSNDIKKTMNLGSILETSNDNDDLIIN
ncbi:hypothetical protein C1645_816089 [Glomus cerebriforme]|uniref:MSP domain-containing protein n=1 Tax=Glomus cerebriforme TaxID=658196 RepID=A0A397TDE3_9GLOM|nr:hypothetical protein C1645_816089 [Glomus cerebriforme]